MFGRRKRSAKSFNRSYYRAKNVKTGAEYEFDDLENDETDDDGSDIDVSMQNRINEKQKQNDRIERTNVVRDSSSDTGSGNGSVQSVNEEELSQNNSAPLLYDDIDVRNNINSAPLVYDDIDAVSYTHLTLPTILRV